MGEDGLDILNKQDRFLAVVPEGARRSKKQEEDIPNSETCPPSSHA